VLFFVDSSPVVLSRVLEKGLLEYHSLGMASLHLTPSRKNLLSLKKDVARKHLDFEMPCNVFYLTL